MARCIRRSSGAYGDRAQYWRSVVARVDSVAKQKRFEDSAGTTTTRERFYNVEIFQLQDLNDDISKDNLAENTVHDMYQSMALLVGNRPGAVLAMEKDKDADVCSLRVAAPVRRALPAGWDFI